jgi:hypothetical protein
MLDSSSILKPCLRCGDEFIADRTNKKYCTPICQKSATRNTARAPRVVADSGEERRRQAIRSRRIQNLTDALFETPPRYRAEFMQKLIVVARRNLELREWLTKREAMGCRAHQDKTGRLHIAFCLDHYCREVYRIRSFVVLEPNTILPTADDLAFPAEYFGPYVVPIYEDGSLNERPCPWSTRPKLMAVKSPKVAPLRSYDWRKVARGMGDPGWRRYFTSEELLEMGDATHNPPSTTV